ncbi:MAG: PpiC-type peptidyl-prolyl cis-trans isomerase [Candidatus Krumholzibacteriota bacterium]|nr:PpiC-type peptidyl-prolyl cis-trans isomerase [Candidatus Krumholzibacteriota bacterium]
MIGGVALPIIVFACLAGCERRTPVSGEDRSPVLAKVGGRELTRKELELFLPEDYRNVLTAEEVRDYVDRWVTTQLLYDEALRSGITPTPEIDKRVEQYKRDLVAEQLVQRIIEEHAVVSEREVREFYTAHEQEYQKEYRVSHILVNTPEEAEEVQARLGKESFETLARQYSADKHADEGGDLGYLSRGNMIPEFEEVVFGMQVGEISDVIASEFGYHIIRVTDIRDTRVALEDSDVAEEITNILTLQKRQAVYDSLVAALRKRGKIEYTDAAAGLGVTVKPEAPSREP